MNLDSAINDRELVTTRVVSVSPERAFEVWTDPKHITHWWGPEGFATTTHKMDLRAGGEWRFTMHDPAGRNYDSRIEFLEVNKPSRLIYRHRDEGEAEPVDFRVTVTFAALGKKTLLTMRMIFESNADLVRIEDAYGASDGQLLTLARFAQYVAVQPRSDRELATSRVLTASPERVYDAFRDPAQLAKWWGPHGFTNTFHSFEFRTGGAWTLTMSSPDGKSFLNEQVFLELEEPRRVVIEHRSKPEYVAEFQLVPVSEGTRIIFFHMFESAEMRERIAKFAGKANDENLERLAAVLQG